MFLPFKKKKIPPYLLQSLVTVIFYTTLFIPPSLYVLPPCPLLPLHWGFPGSWCLQSHSGNYSDEGYNCLPKCCSQCINFSHYPTDLFLESLITSQFFPLKSLALDTWVTSLSWLVPPSWRLLVTCPSPFYPWNTPRSGESISRRQYFLPFFFVCLFNSITFVEV